MMKRRLFLKQIAVGAALAAAGLPKLSYADAPFANNYTTRTPRFYLTGCRDSGGCAVSGSRYNLHDRYPQLYSV